MRLKIASLMLAAAFGLAMAASSATDAQAKGGRGKGLKLGHYKAASFTPPGWSRGRKVGWRGGSMPPGLARRW